MGNHQKLAEYLNECRKAVSPVLFSYLKCEPVEYQEIINEYPRRMGKYLRPALVLLSTQLHGGSTKKALKTAAAMQTSEEWLLIHDDAEDHSTERRSTESEFRPSLNEMIGWEMAINAGDTLHAIMWKMIGDAIKNMPNGWEVFDKFSDIIIGTTEGQYHELNWIHNHDVDVTESDYFRMIDKKTAYYTIIGPLQLGALVANIRPGRIKSIDSFGSPLGRSFQLRDDVLNLTTESEKAGKEKYGDIIEGKRTLILIDMLKKCSSSEREYVKTIYRSESRKKERPEIDYVVKLMHKYGSIEEVSNLATKYAKEAKDRFIKYCSEFGNAESQSKRLMLNLIDFISTRDR
jgi:geranylgeranyl diphosphate synthase type II